MRYSQQNLQGKYIVCTVSDYPTIKIIGKVEAVDALSTMEQTINENCGFIFISSPNWKCIDNPCELQIYSQKGTILINSEKIIKVLTSNEFISEYFEFLL